MKLLHTIAMIAILFISGIPGVSRADSMSAYPTKDFVCKPLPYARRATDAAAQRARLQNLSVCPPEQYPAHPEHPVATVVCRSLPPAQGAETAKVLADALQDLRMCPAGQFPMKYGSGKDLPEGEECVPFHGDLKWNTDGELDDPGIAKTLAEHLAEVQPCPPHFDWKAKTNDLSDPDTARSSGAPHANLSEPPKSNSLKAVLTSSSALSPVCPQSAVDQLYRCYGKAQLTPPSGTSGIEGIFTAEKPFVPKIEKGHSLGQVALSSLSNADNPQSNLDHVELGWRVSAGSPAAGPRLFAAWSMNNYQTFVFNSDFCFNVNTREDRCIQSINGAPFKPNQVLLIDHPYRFRIEHLAHGISTSNKISGWYLSVENQWIGYYPDSFWSNSFTVAEDLQWFGEVAANTPNPTTAMGNGLPATNDDAASIGAISYYDANGNRVYVSCEGGSTTCPAIATDPANISIYSVGQETGVSFIYGGPGQASLSAYVPIYFPTFTRISFPTSFPLQQIRLRGGLGGSIDLQSTLGAVPGSPSTAAVSPDGQTIYVAYSCDNCVPAGTTPGGLIALGTDQSGVPVAPSINLPTSASFGGIVVSPDSRTVYLTAGDNHIWTYTKGGQLNPTITLDAGGASAIAISSDGETLFVDNLTGLSVVNVKSKAIRLISNINVTSMVLSPDQSTLYGTVGLFDANLNFVYGVFAVNVATTAPTSPTFRAITDINNGIGGIAVTPDSRELYVQGDNTDGSTVYVFDVSAPGVIGAQKAKVPIGQSNLVSAGISMSADGSTAYSLSTASTLGNSGPCQSGACPTALVDQIDRAAKQVVMTTQLPGSVSSGEIYTYGLNPPIILGNFAGGR